MEPVVIGTLTITQLIKKFLRFYGTSTFIAVSTTAYRWIL